MLADSAQIIAWARAQLPAGESYVAEQVCTTPYSCVMRLSSGKASYYLKQTPPHLFREAAVTKLLESVAPDAVPQLVASNRELGCFLIADAGDQLRAYLKAGGDICAFVKALQAYAELQQASITHIDDLLALGVPDWRLANLPKLFLGLLNKPDVVLALTSAEQQQLKEYAEVIEAQCTQLAACGIPETIEHPDFQDKNIVVQGKAVCVIDWGEAVISHPFFSMARCMFSASRHHGFDAQHSSTALLKTTFLSQWQAYASPENITAAYALIEQLSLPYSALAYAQLAGACGVEGQYYWSGSIVPLLQSILQTKDAT